MSVEETGVVDLVKLKKDTPEVVLVAVEHREWGGSEHLYQLQEKLNCYLRFIESGELVDTIPAATGRNVTISPVTKYSPNDDAVRFLDRVSETLEAAGFAFTYEVRGG